MAKNGSKEGVVELWGHEFNLAKSGLDETQIVSFVNELISERDQLIRQTEHLSTLTKLAEKTVVEADRLAEAIRKETTDQTEAEAAAIVAKAEEQAQQIIEEKRSEITATATKEAEAIKASAEDEARLLLEHEKERIQTELRDISQQLYRELLSQLGSLKQQVTALEAEFESKLSQPAEQVGAVTEEKELPSAEVSAVLEQASELEEETLLPVDDQKAPAYTGEVELEILPPIDVKQIMGIMRYLDSMAEIENTELIPLTDRPVIVVSLHEPTHLLEILRTLPEVDKASEETPATTDAEGKRRKILITLSGNSLIGEAKEKLDIEVSNTLSS